MGGILTAWWIHIPLFPLTMSFLCLLSVVLLLMLIERSRGRVFLPASTFLMLFCSGCLMITLRTDPRNDSVARFAGGGCIVNVRCTLIDLPRATERSIRFVVEAESVSVFGHTYATSGGVLVSVRRDSHMANVLSGLAYGQDLVLTGELVLPSLARNPGGFNQRQYLLLNDIYGRLYIDEVADIALGPTSRSTYMTRFVYPARRSIADRIDSLVVGDNGRFLKGLLIGERSEIDPEIKMAFVQSGVMHILAVSGLHVIIVVAIILFVLQLLRLPEKACIIVSMVLLTYYAALTGGAPSVVRSVIMANVVLGARLFELKADIYNTLACSAIMLLAFDARQLLQPGFQLSYLAVFSLVYLYPRLYDLKRWMPPSWNRNRVFLALYALFCVSLAAGIGTLPLVSILFGRISLIGFLANMIIVPLSNVVLALGMLCIGMSYLSAWIGGVYATATDELTSLLLWCVTRFSKIPYASVDFRFTPLALILYYGAISFIMSMGREEARKWGMISMLVAMNILMVGWIIGTGATQPLRVTFLDVGQGDATLIQCPCGSNIVVDAGPITPSADAGKQFIAPFFQQSRVTGLDAMVITHPHSDHIGGAFSLLRSVKIATVIDAGSGTESALQSSYVRLIDSLDVRRQIVTSGEMITVCQHVRLYVLHPDNKSRVVETKGRTNLNNESVVIKLLYGRTSLMLSGDAEHEAEDDLVQMYGTFLESDMLKAGHHGSKTSSGDGFLDHVRPSVVVISVGARNKFHHPSATVLASFKLRGVRHYRTDVEGAVIMESDGTGWERIAWR